MKFRLIQSNDRGLLTKVGDRTYARRKPAKGEELLELPTLFIWVKKPQRYLARCWTRWTGEVLEQDFIYEVTRFREVIDLQGQTCFHQWCSHQLRQEMWTMRGEVVDLSQLSCPEPEAVYEANRHKGSSGLQLGREPKQVAGDRPAWSGLDRQGLIAGQLGHPEPGPGLRERRGAGEALLEQELPSAGQHATVPPAQPLGLAQGSHREAKLEELAEVQRLTRGAAIQTPG